MIKKLGWINDVPKTTTHVDFLARKINEVIDAVNQLSSSQNPKSDKSNNQGGKKLLSHCSDCEVEIDRWISPCGHVTLTWSDRTDST